MELHSDLFEKYHLKCRHIDIVLSPKGAFSTIHKMYYNKSEILSYSMFELYTENYLKNISIWKNDDYFMNLIDFLNEYQNND